MQKHTSVCVLNLIQLNEVWRLYILRSLSYDSKLLVTKLQSLGAKI